MSEDSRAYDFFFTWRGRLLILLLIFSFVPLVFFAIWYSSTFSETFRHNRLEALAAIAQGKAATVEQFALDRKSEVERIVPLLVQAAGAAMIEARAVTPSGELPGLRNEADLLEARQNQEPRLRNDDALPGEASSGSPALRVLREDLQLLLWDQSKFEELLVLDPRGTVLASTYPSHEGLSAAELEYFAAGRAGTYVQPVFRSPITGKLSMVVSTPMKAPSGELLGVFAARLNMDRLFQLVSDARGLGDTGEIVVGRAIQDQLVFVTPTRHDPDAALNRKIPLGSEQARPLQDSAQGRSGSAERIDYRGVEVFAAWAPVPSLEWGLVAKTDRDEVMEPITAALRRLVLFAILMALAIIVTAIVASRTLVDPLLKLEAAADEISRGNLDIELNIRSKDEVGDLARSFERMVAAIRFFRASSEGIEETEEIEEEERLESERGGDGQVG